MKIVLLLLGLTLAASMADAQSFRDNLDNKAELSIRDLLQLRLDLLAVQFTSGSVAIWDMGEVNFPVTITLSDTLIEFRLRGAFEEMVSFEVEMRIVQLKMEIVSLKIQELMRYYFPRLYFNADDHIRGYWFESFEPVHRAIWKNGMMHREDQ